MVLEQLNERLKTLKEKRAHMERVNEYYREHHTCRGFPDMSDEEAFELDSAIPGYEQQPFSRRTLQYNSREIETTQDDISHAKMFEALPTVKNVKKRSKRLEKNYWGYIFLVPFFAAYILFSAIPLVTTFYYSVTDRTTFGSTGAGDEEYNYVGFDNFYQRKPFDNMPLFLDELTAELDESRPGYVLIPTTRDKEAQIQTREDKSEYIIAKLTRRCEGVEYDVIRNDDGTVSVMKLGILRMEIESGERTELFTRDDGSEYIISSGNEYEVIRNDDGTIIGSGYTEHGVFGITNYRKAFLNTPLLWIMGFVPQMTIALLFASWFTNVKLKIKGEGFFKVVFYMPNIMTAATIGALFLAFVNSGGIVHQIAVLLGFIESDEVLRSVWFTRGSIATVNTWMWFGNAMIILIAAINSINLSLFEAARIDGASSKRIFRSITLPLIRPVLIFTFVQSLIGGFQMYDIPRILSNSGDASTLHTDGTRTILNVLMVVAFESPSKDLGLASAMSVTLFAMTTVCSVIIFAIMKDRSDDKWLRQQKKLEKLAKANTKGGVV